ncbi:MAG TPA: 1-deoxy-D-xylulose-5-phosphate synthase, partial [Streptosporangiaceae bacterium]|nr:1-deoxy-D-xylulose-5-phosphate synthase [Streptosporangiaceae bacterium]
MTAILATRESTARPSPRISSLRQLRALRPTQLPGAAQRIRDYLIATVARSGGHLGSNLGAVELTMAVHRVFDSPRDRVLFDTGHQAYVHKLLTGRWDAMGTLRRAGGLSGYPCRAESPHDLIESSHASAALAYADGLAKGHELGGEDRHVVVVVGDGALTGGMAWEALNNLGASGRPVVVVLNDNGRSYAPTVGGLAVHLSRLRRGTGDGPTVFENLGLAYLGPVDGHDPVAVERVLSQARALRRPVVVHCVTVKGRGYGPAEGDHAERMHAIPVIDPDTGRPARPASAGWTDVFSEELCAIAAERPDVVAVTAAMPGPTGLAPFAQRYPARYFDVGIAEQHAVTSAAGLAMAGHHPVVAVYATFLTRAVDQVLMDVALHRLPVTFVLDRAGITGPDGASHHGMWDTSILAAVPGLRVAAPRDPARLRRLLRQAVATDGPTVVRYPKAPANGDIPAVGQFSTVDILAAYGEDALLVAYGPMAGPCLAAARWLDGQGVRVTVADPGWVMPVDPALVELAGRYPVVVTAEDASRAGGAG